MFRLMIKEHNVTGMKYMCITKKDDYEAYTGSGIKWKAHLKKHGCNFSTFVLYEDEDYESFLEQCIFYSAEYNVAINEEFANLIPEHGYGFVQGTNWYEYATQEMITDMNAKRKKTLDNWTSERKAENSKIISNASKKYWDSLTLEERRARYEKFTQNVKYNEWKEKCTQHLKKMSANTTFEDYSTRNAKARLSLTAEKKEIRKQKILANHATGKYKHVWEEMGKKRKGIDNPAAKIIVWHGKEYTKGQFDKLNIPENIFEQALLERDDCYKKYNDNQSQYESIACPYCGKISNGKPSGFKKYHLENCKEKNNAKVNWNP